MGTVPAAADVTDPNDPTVVNSRSHTPGAWSTETTISMEWIGGTDTSSGVAGYSFSWTKGVTETPDQTTDTAAYSVPEDGDWWFNLSTADRAGNWTAVRHLGPFYIDTNAPSATVTAPAISTNVSKTKKFTVSWAGSDPLPSSGVVRYRVQYKVGSGGAWGDWLPGTTAASANSRSGSIPIRAGPNTAKLSIRSIGARSANIR